MKSSLFSILSGTFALLFCANGLANDGSGFGLHIAAGSQFSTNVGFDYMLKSKKLNFHVNYGMEPADTSTSVQVSGKMPELSIHWHPGAKAWYVGGGVAAPSFEGVNTQTDLKIKSAVTASVVKVGFLSHGKKSFFGALELSQVSPMSTKSSIEGATIPETDPDYISTLASIDSAAKKSFVEVAVRLGYRF